jgi:hypothetical protein
MVGDSTSIAWESVCWVEVLILRQFCCRRVLGLMRFPTADQKQQRVSVCEELRQTASDDATFSFKVITRDESWI